MTMSNDWYGGDTQTGEHEDRLEGISTDWLVKTQCGEHVNRFGDTYTD